MYPHFYYNALRKTIVQFVDIFNDLVIARYNNDGSIKKYVEVPVVVAPKSKQYWHKFKRQNKLLPIIGIWPHSLEFNKERIANKKSKIKIKTDRTDIKAFVNPIPYDISFRVQIASEYMIDIIQIVEQILPFFGPELYTRITIPELNIDEQSIQNEMGTNPLEIKIIYESNSFDPMVEMDESDYSILLWDLDFRAQGYLFKPSLTYKQIKNINISWYLDENNMNKDFIGECKDKELCAIVKNLYNDTFAELERDICIGKCVLVINDKRYNKTNPPELAKRIEYTNIIDPKDLSNHVICWDGEKWTDTCIVNDPYQYIEGDIINTSTVSSTGIGLFAGKYDLISGTYDDSMKKLTSWEDGLSGDE